MLEGVEAELGLIQDKSPHNSSGKPSYYKEEELNQLASVALKRKIVPPPFPISGVGKDKGYLTVRERKLEKIGSHLSLFILLLTLLTPSRLSIFFFFLVREQDSCPEVLLNWKKDKTQISLKQKRTGLISKQVDTAIPCFFLMGFN